jgi:hypothetical protein
MPDWADNRENNDSSIDRRYQANAKHTALFRANPVYLGLKELFQLPRHFLCIYTGPLYWSSNPDQFPCLLTTSSHV